MPYRTYFDKIEYCWFCKQTVVVCTKSGNLRNGTFCSFHSIVRYGIIFWGNSTTSYKVFKLQKSVIRIVPGAEPRASCRGLFRRLEILPVSCQYILSLMLFIVDNPDNFRQFQKFMDHIQEVKINYSFQIQTSQVLKNVIKLLCLGKTIRKTLFDIFSGYVLLQALSGRWFLNFM